MTSACTIVAGNYLVRATVLADSFFAHHPEGAFTVLVVDDEDRALPLDDPRVDWRRLGDIGLDTAEIHRLAGFYDVTELSTAVKPQLLRRLLDEGRSEVIYLDPDIVIYDSLAEVMTLAARHGIVLTPHITAPFPDDGRQIDALFVLAAGVYNLGFLGVGSSARPFLDWWWRQTRRHALNDITRMLFTDQRWVDYVPSLFEHHLLKDPGYNVAYWNLHARTVKISQPPADETGTDTDGRYVVSDTGGAHHDVPLRFFHFSGFDPRQPWLLSRHQGERPRVLLSEHPVLARICADYVARVEAAEAAAPAIATGHRYGWAKAAAGLALTPRVRRVYWRGIVDAELGLAPEPPDPFDRAHPDRFVRWLNTPGERGSRRWSRFLAAVYAARAELQSHFPDIDGQHAPQFADWVWRYGIEQEEIPVQLLPPRDGDGTPAQRAALSPPRAQAAPARGLNIAGYFRAGFGVAEAARLLLDAVEAAGIPHTTHTHDVTFSPPIHAFEDRATEAGAAGDTAAFDITVLCANADQTRNLAREMGPEFFADRHTVGYWFWEAAPLPDGMHHAFDHVDEVWTATDYVAGILRAAGRKPVFTIPLPLPAPEAPASPDVAKTDALTRLGLPDRFTFLLIFDFLSVAERKNPLGLIAAFTRAFAPDEGPVLVLKSINGNHRLPEVERLRNAIAGRPDIVLIDAHYTAEEKNALLAACDCYVSLHRAEGLGLTMAEAMALGKPVIATGYSGNLHFMTHDNSFLVHHTVVPVADSCRPYVAGGRWADPDLDHAARLMREVYMNPAAAAEKGARGRADVRERHGVAASAAAIARRVETIHLAREAKRLVREASAPRVTDIVTPPPTAAVAEAEAPAVEATVATAGNAASATTVAAPVEGGAASDLSAPATAPVAPAPVPVPGAPAIAALEALLPQLEQLARPRLGVEGRRWPALRGFLQRTLFRLLQPYAFQQRQFQQALVDALRASLAQLAAQQADALARQDQTAAQFATYLAEMEQRTLTRQQQTDAHQIALSYGATEVQASIASLRSEVQALAFAVEGQPFVQRASDGSLRMAFDGTPAAHPSHDTHAAPRTNGAHGTDGSHGTNPSPGTNGSRGATDDHNGHHPLFLTRARLYLPLLADRTPVLDIGCGTGRMLDLLRSANLPSFGIDPNPQLVSHCRANGHLVEQADALSFLRARGNEGVRIGAIFSTQLHDAPDMLSCLDLLALCRRRLPADGVLIAEAQLSDTVGVAPLRPEALLALCHRAGFGQARVLFHPDAQHPESYNGRRASGRYAVAATPGSGA